MVVKPSWEEYLPRPGDLVLELDPGMAFGTGAHPTTQLCLEVLEDVVRPGERVLDFGPLIQAEAAEHPVRDPGPGQRQLHRLGGVTGSGEDEDLRPRDPGGWLGERPRPVR